MQPLTTQWSSVVPLKHPARGEPSQDVGAELQASVFTLLPICPHGCLHHIHRPSISLHFSPGHKAHKGDLCSRELLVFTSWQSDQNKCLQKDRSAVWDHCPPSPWPFWTCEPNPGSAVNNSTSSYFSSSIKILASLLHRKYKGSINQINNLIAL